MTPPNKRLQLAPTQTLWLAAQMRAGARKGRGLAQVDLVARLQTWSAQLKRGTLGGRQMAPATARRLADFERRAQYAPDDVLKHVTGGWRYIAVHPFADDHELLDRLDWPVEQCRSVDAYWECTGDVFFIQVEDKGMSIRAPGFYYRWTDNDAYAVNLVAVLEQGPIARGAFESVMSKFEALLPTLGRAQVLTRVGSR